MKKGDVVKVVTGGLFPFRTGVISHFEINWNITYAMVIFSGQDNPIKMNTDRLELVAG